MEEIEYVVTLKMEDGAMYEALRATATNDGDLSVQAPDQEALLAVLDKMQEMIDYIRENV